MPYGKGVNLFTNRAEALHGATCPTFETTLEAP